MDKQKEDEGPSLRLQVIEFICQRYEPAESFEDATITLTTIQLLQQIAKHTGDGMITVKYLYDCLQEMGYKYDTIGDTMEFVWLIKEDV